MLNFSSAWQNTATLSMSKIATLGPLLSALLDTGGIDKSRKLSNRELAIWLTAITCVCIYFSLAVARECSSEAALIMTADGPSPFDGATVSIPVIFSILMAIIKRYSGK